MWGTDGARVFTVEEGWGWTFVAVEHWNAECVGWHVCKQGTRFAALEPISQGLMATAGSVTADAGRGLSLRMDHGTQYLSDHFQNQLRHWGISPSFTFIEQPQTDGVAERFIRTLKEQVIYGRVFQNLQEGREAVKGFVDTYNREWLVEKAISAPGRPGPNGSSTTQSPRRVKKNLCPRNRMRYKSTSDHPRDSEIFAGCLEKVVIVALAVAWRSP
jgi:transposase InsO family protein